MRFASNTQLPSASQYLALTAMIAAVFLGDMLTPVGMATWLLYVFPVWYASRLPRGAQCASHTAVICSVLVGIGFVLSPSSDYPVFSVAVNRSLGVGLLSLSAVVLARASHRKEALQHQATLLQEHAALLDRAHVLVRGLDGRIITWTRGLEQLYGWTKAEARGQRAQELMRTRFPTSREDCEAELFRHGEWSGELMRTHKDGRPVTVAAHWVLHRDPGGRPSAVLEISNDITELKRTQEALRESRERLELALNAAQLGTWDVDLTTGEMVESIQRASMFGLPPGVSNRTIWEWQSRLHPDDAPRMLKHVQEAFRAGTEFEVEYRVIWRDGSLHWVASRGSVLTDENGKPKRAIGVSYDVTSHKNAEAEIRRLLDQAQDRERELRDKQEQLVQAAKLAGLGELSTGVAHELNNPLNNIGLFVGNAIDRLRQASPDVAQIVRELQRTLDQVKKAATIITHLRTFGRMAPRERGPVDVNEVIRSGLSLIQEQLRLRGVDVHVELASEPAVVMGNRIQLEQVIVNLLTNARDAVESSERKQIGIRTAMHGRHVWIEVRDTGHGIPADAQTRVFDPFFTTKEVGQGTGLGLSITYGIVQDHKGHIRVKSGPGEGAVFQIMMPRAITVEHTAPASV